jgi:translation initiation factor IF-1
MTATRTAVATVVELLPNERYRLELEGGRTVTGTVPAEARGRVGCLRVGSRLQVEVSPFDRSQVRILGVAS